MEWRLIERARIINKLLDGEQVQKVVSDIETSQNTVIEWRVLRKEGICLARQRNWCVSTDPEFAPKAADTVGLYLAPPEKVPISVMEH